MSTHAARAVLAAALFAFGPDAAAAQAAAQEVRIGSFAGLTGPVAQTAVDVTQARSLAAMHVNEGGGFFADGRPMALLLADSACDPDAAVAAGRALAQAGLAAALAPMCSGAAAALATQVTIPEGLPMVADTATARSLSLLADRDLLFRVAPTDAQQAKVLAELAVSEGRRRIVVAHAQDAYNAGLAQLFAEALAAAGGEVVASSAHAADRIDYAAEAADLAASAAGADALAIFAYYNSSGIDLLEAAIATGAFGRIYGADGLANPEVGRRFAPEQLAMVRIVAPDSDRGTEAWARFEAAADAVGLNPRAPYAAQAYDAAFLLALAVEKAGTADRAAVARALRDVAQGGGDQVLPGEWARAKASIAGGESVDYHGASGPIEFDAAGDVQGRFIVWSMGADGAWSASPAR